MSTARILQKICQLEQYLAELNSILPKTFKDYANNLVVKRACEKTAELSIETVLDLVAMVVSLKQLGLPQDEENLIDIIVKGKVISSNLGLKVKSMKGFRNVLVHKYGSVDDRLVYRYLVEEQKDFTAFLVEIKKYLKK